MNPWYKTTLNFAPPHAGLSLKVPHDVFSTQRIDEGTLLLLNHLPANSPKNILDMGCGYGALGLPIAKKYPGAKVEMVDRDLLAVHWSAMNAKDHHLNHVEAYGSLGFSNVKQSNYDWILCNVPARIGSLFIQNFFKEANARLTDGGEIRVVVIHDLCPALEDIRAKMKWNLKEIAKGQRHTIFGINKFSEVEQTKTISDEELYLRDLVVIDELTLMRPYDLGGDDPKRLQSGLPVLLDALPRKFTGSKIFCFRSGYGQIPLIAAKRFSQASITVTDRDLLGMHFTKLNAQKLTVEDPRFKLIPAYQMSQALKETDRFDLILGELSSSAGDAVALDEIQTVHQHLAPGGEALLLCLNKLEKEIVRMLGAKPKFRIQKVLTRSDYSVIRIT